MRQLLKTTFTVFVALVFTAGMAFGQSNTSTVDQQGDDNSAQVSQSGGSSATVNQSGNDIARLSQSGGSSATITQNANDDARLKQTGGSQAVIVQEKGANKVYGIGDATFNQQASRLEVTSQDVGYGGGNVVRGEQYGRNNTADIDQHNSSFTRLLQQGVGNSASIQQYLGEPQFFDLRQVGNNNVVDFLQTGGDEGSYAKIRQNGNRNEVNGLDEARLGEVTVEGADSRATQVNGDQTLRLTQSGFGNELYMRQSGMESKGDNELYMSQRNGAYAEVQQLGDGNSISGERGQKAVSNSSWAFINQKGTSNTLDFDQFTSGNSMTVTQNGSGNSATVTQN